MKKTLLVLGCLALVFAVYMSYTTVDSTTPVAVAGKSYSGTVYIAGMGGHFATADVTIDPSAKQPIKINKLGRIVIGNKSTHPTHDARIDVNDRNKMFWSTYKIDKEIGADKRTAHVGVTDLKTGKVLIDKAVVLDDRAKWTGALYCGSGQTKDSYLPVTMTNEAYIDVFDKKSLKLSKRVFLKDLGYDNNYFFYHGINSPDMKTFAIAINMTTKWDKPTAPGKRIGKIDMLLVDLPELEKGNVKVLKKNTITGSTTKTFTFRQTFTPDGKYLLQSGADRFYLLDGKTLELLDEEMLEIGENHDALTTPDGKYAVLTLRTKIEGDGGKKITDGTLALYDIEARKVIGSASSVCNDCHKNVGLGGNMVLCGADVNWN